MRELANVAQRLREVREASRRFLQIHAMEVEVIGPALDRVAKDVESKSLTEPPAPQGPEPHEGRY